MSRYLVTVGLRLRLGNATDHPFTASIADAEEIIRLVKEHNAPLMGGSSIEFGEEVPQMQAFSKEKGPFRAYEAYGAEGHFTGIYPM